MRVHHVALRTPNLPRLVGFYRQVFGLFELRDLRPRSVWLALGGGAVLMIEARGPGEPAVPQGSLELLAFAATEAEKATVRAVASSLGCLDGETDHTVYLRDPDGRRVGVSTYRFDAPPLTR